MVKNHFFELENNEMQYNLKLQEKMNKILKNEIDRLKAIMKRNNISLPQKVQEEEGDEVLEEAEPPRRDNSKGRAPQPQSEYDFSKKNRPASRDKPSSRANLGYPSAEKGIRAKSPGLNTQDIRNIRTEIAHAQEVINQVPPHIKDKAKGRAQ